MSSRPDRSNEDANEIARELGYEGAEDLKEAIKAGATDIISIIPFSLAGFFTGAMLEVTAIAGYITAIYMIMTLCATPAKR